jgi:hypothetical protein
VVLQILAFRIAVSVEITISAIISWEAAESVILKAITSVGALRPKNFKFNALILSSSTKQIVISPGFFVCSKDRTLRTADFTFFGLMGIFF